MEVLGQQALVVPCFQSLTGSTADCHRVSCLASVIHRMSPHQSKCGLEQLSHRALPCPPRRSGTGCDCLGAARCHQQRLPGPGRFARQGRDGSLTHPSQLSQEAPPSHLRPVTSQTKLSPLHIQRTPRHLTAFLQQYYKTASSRKQLRIPPA